MSPMSPCPMTALSRPAVSLISTHIPDVPDVPTHPQCPRCPHTHDHPVPPRSVPVGVHTDAADTGAAGGARAAALRLRAPSRALHAAVATAPPRRHAAPAGLRLSRCPSHRGRAGGAAVPGGPREPPQCLTVLPAVEGHQGGVTAAAAALGVGRRCLRLLRERAPRAGAAGAAAARDWSVPGVGGAGAPRGSQYVPVPSQSLPVPSSPSQSIPIHSQSLPVPSQSVQVPSQSLPVNPSSPPVPPNPSQSIPSPSQSPPSLSQSPPVCPSPSQSLPIHSQCIPVCPSSLPVCPSSLPVPPRPSQCPPVPPSIPSSLSHVPAPPRVSLLPSRLSPGVLAELRCDAVGFFPLDVEIRWERRTHGHTWPYLGDTSGDTPGTTLGPSWSSGHRRAADGTFSRSAGLRVAAVAPGDSYSCLVTHVAWNVPHRVTVVVAGATGPSVEDMAGMALVAFVIGGLSLSLWPLAGK
uniref:Ig-like domain-containing protein n=1 Tax=Taeniopygia guttata TaxID=59729 RepID=A0A674H1L6_TAEGU